MTCARGWYRLIAGACAAGLVLAGCGGGDGGGPVEEPEYRSPLAEFFGWNDRWDDQDEFSEQERQRHYEVQDYIVACMEEAGFEYQPEPFWADIQESQGYVDPFEEVWRLRYEDPEAFAKEYGYGVTTIDYDEVEIGPWETPGPNDDYRESLSGAAQLEYDKALWGDWEEVEEAAEAGDPVEIGGCQNKAFDAVYGSGDEDSRFEALYEEWDKLYDRIENDPRLVEAVQAWSDCMADAGYPDLEDLYAGENLVYQRQSEAYGWDDDPEALPVPEDPEAEPEEWTVPELDPQVKAELREFELEVAWADYECQQEHDVERVQREVQHAHEEQFIEDHRADLEAYRDWMNQREGVA